MKKIHIGFDHKHEPVGLVLANTKDIAWAFFTGRGDIVATIEEIDLSDDIITSQPLVVLLTSKEKCQVVDNMQGKSYHKWKREINGKSRRQNKSL